MPAERHRVRRPELLITCEHGGNRIPARYRRAFAGGARALASHEGYDPGALELARDFARRLGAPLFYSDTSRLLVELNRSLPHARIFSRYARRLAPEERREVLQRYYLPYRASVEARVASAIRRGRGVVHLSCHSFTPRLAGRVRTTDVGLLFDPQRAAEAALCRRWQLALAKYDRSLRVKRNYPYRGCADGFTTYLRASFGPVYLGIELEVNQRFPREGGERWKRLRRALIETFPR